jgi:hypothetical protein
LTAYGSPSEIATRHFGGVRGMKDAVSRLQTPCTNNSKNEITIPWPKPAPPHTAAKKSPAPRKAKAPLTTRENLSALIGTARKILRKDKGLNGDADRLPLLTWVMFLKFLDDLEIVHAQEAELDGKRYEPIIEAPYRWRDWAAREDGISGDELLAFIGQEQTRRADGSAGPGLFAYLRGLASRGAKGSQREVIANVFKGVQNRMVSGYLLRDILNKINGIHFSASEEMHTLSHLYESMLREMRDAAGDSGEFYTPRPVVRFMVQVVRPATGRDGAGPGLRHGWLPGGGLRPPGDPGEEPRPAAHPAAQHPLRPGSQTPALHAGADEPAAARAGGASRSPMATRWSAASTRSATASAWT